MIIIHLRLLKVNLQWVIMLVLNLFVNPIKLRRLCFSIADFACVLNDHALTGLPCMVQFGDDQLGQ